MPEGHQKEDFTLAGIAFTGRPEGDSALWEGLILCRFHCFATV